MPLPKIQQPLFELTIPSTGKKIQYKPFTVKEEKILLIAQESKDLDQIITAINQIITNCIENIDVDELAMFDLEYLLINLRSKSVGNEVDFKIKDPDTEEVVELSIDLNDIEIKKDEKHNKIIEVNDDISMVMQYPKLNQLKALNGEEENQEQALFDVMIGCIDSVVEGEEVYKLKDFTKKEVDEFVESLSTTHIQNIKTFFETMPKLRYEKKYTLEDGTEKTFVAEGTETFFI